MTFRVRVDVTNANGMTDHITTAVELQKWSATDAKAQIKRRYPNAKAIKLFEHTP